MNFQAISVILVLALGTPQSPPAPPPAVPAQEGTAEQAPAPAPTGDPDSIGVSLERIQKGVSKGPALKLTENRSIYRIEIFGAKPTIEDILGPDFWRGPVPYGGMTHQEFLEMVTPKDVQGYAPFSNAQGMVVAATSIALQWALQKAMDKLKNAKNERAKEAAQREVQDALDALRKARREAGLPDK
jgi:hypothetical protein